MSIINCSSAFVFKFGLSRLRLITRYPHPDKPSLSLYRTAEKSRPKFNFKWHIVSWSFKNFDQYLDPRVPHACHAISIDEKRTDFNRVPWGSKPQKTDSPSAYKGHFEQVWFAGDHTDIGGGYPHQEAGLSDITLSWMVDKLKKLPENVRPVFDERRLFCDPDPLASQHCSVQSLEYAYPAWWPKSIRFSWPIKNRKIPDNAPLHPSVVKRL